MTAVIVPFRVVKRSGRKEMLLPPGASRQRARVDLVKALARAFRWKRMLDLGEFVTMAELARRESIAVSYVNRILGLKLLALELVDAILVGRQGPEVTLVRVLERFPMEWAEQAALLRTSSRFKLPCFSD